MYEPEPPFAEPVTLTSSPICAFVETIVDVFVSVFVSPDTVTVKVFVCVSESASLTITLTSYFASAVGVKVAVVAEPNSVPSTFHFVFVDLL